MRAYGNGGAQRNGTGLRSGPRLKEAPKNRKGQASFWPDELMGMFPSSTSARLLAGHGSGWRHRGGLHRDHALHERAENPEVKSYVEEFYSFVPTNPQRTS